MRRERRREMRERRREMREMRERRERRVRRMRRREMRERRERRERRVRRMRRREMRETRPLLPLCHKVCKLPPASILYLGVDLWPMAAASSTLVRLFTLDITAGSTPLSSVDGRPVFHTHNGFH